MILQVEMTSATARVIRKTLEQIIGRLERGLEYTTDKQQIRWSNDTISNLKFLHSKLGGRRYKEKTVTKSDIRKIIGGVSK